MEPRPSSADPIKSLLMRQGFPAVGAVDFELAKLIYDQHFARYEAWISNGFHGEMEYLKRGLAFRKDPRGLFSTLKSAFIVLSPYPSVKVGSSKIQYARYLNGTDYHVEMKARLTQAFEMAKNDISDLQFKVCVDTSGVLERTWAAMAGLGWIGKNTLLIHPQLGSYCFIGVVFTNIETGLGPVLHPDYCGNCERCLKSCPTQAILDSHEVNSEKCISYLTLEKRGTLPSETHLSNYVAGCDICQEVCPYNSKVSKPELTSTQNIEKYLVTDMEQLCTETEESYRQRIKGTALSRIKFADFKRNLNLVKA